MLAPVEKKGSILHENPPHKFGGFLTDEGKPMLFYFHWRHLTELERNVLKEAQEEIENLTDIVTKYGGLISSERESFSIPIGLKSLENSYSFYEELYSASFLTDSVRLGKILNLRDYQLNRLSLYDNDFDPNDVLFHHKIWGDISSVKEPLNVEILDDMLFTTYSGNCMRFSIFPLPTDFPESLLEEIRAELKYVLCSLEDCAGEICTELGRHVIPLGFECLRSFYPHGQEIFSTKFIRDSIDQQLNKPISGEDYDLKMILHGERTWEDFKPSEEPTEMDVSEPAPEDTARNDGTGSPKEPGNSKEPESPPKKGSKLFIIEGTNVPMVFSVNKFSLLHSHQDLMKVEELIKEHGGICTNDLRQQGHTIRLAISDYGLPLEEEIFDAKFITGCRQAGKVLDLNEYRFASRPLLEYEEPVDPNDILHGRKRWEDTKCRYNVIQSFAREVESKQLAVEEKFDSIREPAKRSGKLGDFTNAERIAIIRYIANHNAYGRVSGNKLWEEIMAANICPGRSFHSLRNHFLKKILPEIHTFGKVVSPLEKEHFRLRKPIERKAASPIQIQEAEPENTGEELPSPPKNQRIGHIAFSERNGTAETCKADLVPGQSPTKCRSKGKGWVMQREQVIQSTEIEKSSPGSPSLDNFGPDMETDEEDKPSRPSFSKTSCSVSVSDLESGDEQRINLIYETSTSRSTDVEEHDSSRAKSLNPMAGPSRCFVEKPSSGKDKSPVCEKQLKMCQNGGASAIVAGHSRQKMDETSFKNKQNDSKRSTTPLSSSRRRKGYWKRVPYSLQEDMQIISHIIANRRFDEVKGVALWKAMEQTKVLDRRTWQAMKERFRKHILPRIEDYNITEEEKNRIIKGYELDRGLGGRRAGDVKCRSCEDNHSSAGSLSISMLTSSSSSSESDEANEGLERGAQAKLKARVQCIAIKGHSKANGKEEEVKKNKEKIIASSGMHESLAKKKFPNKLCHPIILSGTSSFDSDSDVDELFLKRRMRKESASPVKKRTTDKK